jgi:hypothetical protein
VGPVPLAEHDIDARSTQWVGPSRRVVEEERLVYTRDE